MKFNFILLLLFINSIITQAQISNFKEKFELPIEVKETSGLLFINGKIITHNDSGDSSNLYEIDSLSGELTRTVSISNATNIDWEDISENSTHIFIADIGNNNGNRQDLKIYKVLKSDFKNNNTISAEIISFTYEDQTDFSNNPNRSNFDAEGIVIYGSDILIFTKNWADLKTNVYKTPITSGNYSASKISTANVEGLITGAVYNDDRFILTGYDSALVPFLIYIGSNRIPGDDLFASGFNKISLENYPGQGSQIEGITNIGATGSYYISREKFTATFFGTKVDFPQKLYEFHDDTSSLLSVVKNDLEFIKISPNPVIDEININTNLQINKIEVFNILGKKISINSIQYHNKIDLSSYSKGVYYLRINFQDYKTVIKKIIKL